MLNPGRGMFTQVGEIDRQDRRSSVELAESSVTIFTDGDIHEWRGTVFRAAVSGEDGRWRIQLLRNGARVNGLA